MSFWASPIDGEDEHELCGPDRITFASDCGSEPGADEPDADDERGGVEFHTHVGGLDVAGGADVECPVDAERSGIHGGGNGSGAV